MKKFLPGLLLILFVGNFLFFMIGCTDNKFTIDTAIQPKIKQIKFTLAVEYYLGDLLILDEWDEDDLNSGQIVFLTEKQDPIDVHLRIEGDDDNFTCTGCKLYFIYTVANIEIRTRPIAWEPFISNIDSMPNVKWIKRDGKSLIVNEDVPQGIKRQPDVKVKTPDTTTNKL